ncbi:hypothetical protein B0H67DRAFT_549168 [Lasiosphaeris hirsuta]|uniref:Uncharacterized protein n=1 Tax=Lasiosphaeris hirsuta TaxID=260670 RepID=A0AA40EBL5_9PEZI|nr:hypothetical protein B0H67DRAFT_549168 [Lasiosphaeris hirsuta]
MAFSSGGQPASIRGGSVDGTWFRQPPKYDYGEWRREQSERQEREAAEKKKDPRVFGLPPPKWRAPQVVGDSEYEVLPRDELWRKRILAIGLEESVVRPASWPDHGQRDLRDLTSGSWRPTRLGFHIEWPADELGTLWYEMVIVHLFLRVSVFANTYFGFSDITEPVSGFAENPTKDGIPRLWNEGRFSKEFRHYASLVARQDNNSGGWDVLLSQAVHRKYLVTGIIARVLQAMVFDELLFGADSMQLTMFDAQDKALLEVEGYRRTNLRARTVRAILGSDMLTPDFWPEVDRLALQLTEMLLPLMRVMDKYFPASRGESLRSLHQDLHNIVSEAAFLSIGIRWSHYIFRFDWPLLGQGWEKNQENYDNTPFERSTRGTEIEDQIARRKKLAAKSAEERPRERMRVLQYLPFAYGLKDPTAGATSSLVGSVRHRLGLEGEDADDGISLKRATLASEEEWFAPPRMAKIQMVLWPLLQCWAPTRPLDSHPDNLLYAEDRGEKVTTLFTSKVVYYIGRVDPEGETEELEPTVERHLSAQRWERVRHLGLAVAEGAIQVTIKSVFWLVLAAVLWGLLLLVAPHLAVAQKAVETAKWSVLVVWNLVWNSLIEAVSDYGLAAIVGSLSWLWTGMRTGTWYPTWSWTRAEAGSGPWVTGFAPGRAVLVRGWGSLKAFWRGLFASVRGVGVGWKTVSFPVPTIYPLTPISSTLSYTATVAQQEAPTAFVQR